MARPFAQLKTAVWNDDDFRALHVLAQWLYWALLSQPLLSYCGVVTYTHDAFADLAQGLTPAQVRKAGKALEAGGYIVIDPRTAELWCRTFIRHDGLLKQPNLIQAAANAYRTVRSSQIRNAILGELLNTASHPAADAKTREGAERLHRLIRTGPQAEGSAGPPPAGSAAGSTPPQPAGSGEGPRDATRATPSPTPSTTVLGSVDPLPPETQRASEKAEESNNGHPSSPDPFLAAVSRARKRAGRDADGWTWPNIRTAIDRAIDAELVNRDENARDLIVALASDQRTDLPARLATEAGANTARGILNDQRRDQARARAEAQQRQEATTAEQVAEANRERRAHGMRRYEQLPVDQRQAVWAEATAYVRDLTGLTPVALVQLRVAELMDRQEAAP